MADFDWNGSSLTQDWWQTTGATIGASEKAIKFACCKFMGKSNTESARLAGYGGHSEANVRTEGYRCARSNKVVQLLSLAAAEAGGGVDGCVTAIEAKQILSHLARGSDPAVRIKALESLAKMAEREDEARRAEPEPTFTEVFAGLITCLPMSGLGAAMAMGTYYSKVGDIFNFPFLELCAPIVVLNFPTEWQRFRNNVKRADMAEYLDQVAAGPVLDGDALVNAVNARANTTRRPVKESADAA